MEDPLVSVVIAAFNGEKYISEAIGSALKQNYEPMEIIVVDDGSTDATNDIVKRFHDVILITQTNQGNAVARNRGIQESRGKYIAFLDQDDYWVPEKISLQVQCLKPHVSAALCLCLQRSILEDKSNLPSWVNKLAHNQTAYVPSAWLVDRKAFEVVGLFDPKFPHGSDSDWLFRAKDRGIQTFTVPRTLLCKRLHTENLSYHGLDMKSEMLKLVRDSVHRKKGKENHE